VFDGREVMIFNIIREKKGRLRLKLLAIQGSKDIIGQMPNTRYRRVLGADASEFL
jgi:hypothetical protein